jgi:hypothetical protein
MNSDSEAFFSQLFTWLSSEDTTATAAHPLGDSEGIDGVNSQPEATAITNGSGEGLQWTPQTFNLGEIPAVEDRFQAVLKRRLQIEVQKHPPLFPWESEVSEYPDYVDNSYLELVPANFWMQVQKQMSLPTILPENIFRELLSGCQTVVKSPLPTGRKLIRAVENLFPNESQTLNDLAAVVLMSTAPGRSVHGNTVALKAFNSQTNYSELQPSQQMVFSLLAAKQMLDVLTLSLSATNRTVERQWLTTAGPLQLQVEYNVESKLKRLQVQGDFPCSGILKLQGEGVHTTANCSTPSSLSLEISGVRPHQVYPLLVQFPELDMQDLVFAICPT